LDQIKSNLSLFLQCMPRQCSIKAYSSDPIFRGMLESLCVNFKIPVRCFVANPDKQTFQEYFFHFADFVIDKKASKSLSARMIFPKKMLFISHAYFLLHVFHTLLKRSNKRERVLVFAVRCGQPVFSEFGNEGLQEILFHPLWPSFKKSVKAAFALLEIVFRINGLVLVSVYASSNK
jgi:hypothetical protein